MTRPRRANASRIAWVLVLSAAGLTSLAAQFEPPAATGAQRAALLAAARDIMQQARYCAVITNDESGQPRARTIDAFMPDDAMVVWFATNPKSRKVRDLQQDPRITLYYFDSRSPELGYVSLIGRARLVDDKAEKQKRWKEGWEAFWPDRGASFLLVEVTPMWLEVVSPKHGIDPDPVTWRPPFVEFPDTTKRGRE